VQRQLRKRPHRQWLLTSVATDLTLLASSTSAQVSDETIGSLRSVAMKGDASRSVSRAGCGTSQRAQQR
jgi:hypothetical protein